MQADVLPDIEVCVGEYLQTLDSPMRRAQLVVKRVLDIVIALLALIVAFPLLVLLIIIIRIESPGPAIYRQRRLGRSGHIFTMYKLRTMYANSAVVLNPDGSTRVIENDPRVTRTGKCLRTFGVDELPQLFNVIKGDMSLVGPRPDQDFHLQWYREDDYRKLAMRPGITSLGQVSGRNAIPWRVRMEWELEYVEQFSLWTDLKIVARTLAVIVNGVGTYNDRSERAHFRSPSARRREVGDD